MMKPPVLTRKQGDGRESNPREGDALPVAFTGLRAGLPSGLIAHPLSDEKNVECSLQEAAKLVPVSG